MGKLFMLAAVVVATSAPAWAETQAEVAARVQLPGETERLLHTPEGQAAIKCMFKEMVAEAHSKGIPFSKVHQPTVAMWFVSHCAEENTAFMDVVGDDQIADAMMAGVLNRLTKQ